MGWMGPLHGHFCLGISIPENPEPDSTFLTAHDWGWDRALLKPLASRTSTLVALRTELDTSTRQKVKQTAVAQCPAEYSIRPFCKWRAKRDAMIYNRLANLSMHHHPDFDSLTPEEDWELLKNSLLAIVPDYFLFLYHKDKPIGFCWGIPDYQEALTGQRSTLGYLAQLLKKSRYHRGRIIYSCILPEYQGQGLCKLIRHRVLNNMIRDGIEVVESSYIHTENENSLSNAQSTGAQLSHRFHYFHGEA